jgi:hypothetical protein
MASFGAGKRDPIMRDVIRRWKATMPLVLTP